MRCQRRHRAQRRASSPSHQARGRAPPPGPHTGTVRHGASEARALSSTSSPHGEATLIVMVPWQRGAPDLISSESVPQPLPASATSPGCSPPRASLSPRGALLQLQTLPTPSLQGLACSPRQQVWETLSSDRYDPSPTRRP